MKTTRTRILIVSVMALYLAPATAAVEDPLVAARELYASAAYEEALAALSQLNQTQTENTPASREEIDQYRAFCLFALGRTVEAKSVAEALIQKNPRMQLEATDASPRITAMFTDVRRR